MKEEEEEEAHVFSLLDRELAGGSQDVEMRVFGRGWIGVLWEAWF